MASSLSPLHAMIEKIGRERHAKRLNRIANHPDILPWVQGPHPAPLDFSDAIQDPRNVLLMSQHGGLLFSQLSPGIYEVHTMVLPEGRGEWALMLAKACLHWMFTRTDAMEVVTKCPRGNVAAHALARAAGMREAFDTQPIWPLREKIVPCKVYSLTIQDWMAAAPGLEDRGRWVKRRLGWEGIDLTSKPSPGALRYHGLAFEMFLSGQVHKGVLLLARWSMLCGLHVPEVVSERPASIAFQGGIVIVRDDGEFYVAGPDKTLAALH